MAFYQNFADIPSLLEKDCVTYATVQELFRHFEENYKHHGKITDESLIALSSVFGATLEKALELIEADSVKFFHIGLESVGVFQVEGSLAKKYTIFPFINYCSCLAYKYQVAGGSYITCKHVLASIIGNIIGRVELVEISLSQLNNLLLAAACLNKSAMNKRDTWPNRNQYVEQYVYPQPEISPAFASTSNWVQIPPQTMPWGLPCHSHPPVVRFTAGDLLPHHHPVKRKQECDFDMRLAKQLVTEEKMAAHMSNLHISDIELPTPKGEDDIMEVERLPKLYVCDEVKSMKVEPIIPEAILNKVERPKLAVVLWQPPTGDIMDKLAELKKDNEKDEKEEKEEKEDIIMAVDNDNVDNTFRPIDPVPMHPLQQNQFLQPTPQFHGFFPLS